MVKDNETRVRKDLDGIRYDMKKFVCLNDDMNKTHPNPLVRLRALVSLVQFRILLISLLFCLSVGGRSANDFTVYFPLRCSLSCPGRLIPTARRETRPCACNLFFFFCLFVCLFVWTRHHFMRC